MSGRVYLAPANKVWYEYLHPLPEELCVSDDLFEDLWNLHPVEFGEFHFQGKIIPTPRWQTPILKDYTFSRATHRKYDINHPLLDKLIAWASERSGYEYNSGVIVWYQDGNHYIGKHADDERELVDGAPIYSFTYGQERDFRMIPKSSNKTGVIQKIALQNNSMFIMGGEFQKHWLHEVPKRALSKCPNRRINITLRVFKE